jgi:hypothetical protein
MSAQVSGSGGKPVGRGSKAGAKAEGGRREKQSVTDDTLASGSPTAIEQAIDERRAHLAATIDELTSRAQPKEIARRSLAGLQARARNVTHTPEGQLRTERLVAVGGAAVVIAGVMLYLRRRRRT